MINNKLLAIACFFAAAVIIVFSFFNFSLDIQLKPYSARLLGLPESPEGRETARIEKEVLPAEGVILPVRWGDLGSQLVKAGVINADKFESVYKDRGGLDEESQRLLYGSENGNIKITKENSGVLLNLLWAIGLGNKNIILEKGPMSDKKYGGAERFASTGGWTLADGGVMDHYSRHEFFSLTPEQQQLVEETSWNIYRSCCDNPTYFPDCNHGMAMLGFLELMASQSVSEAEMYKAALMVNSYWFPETYINLARYFDSTGTPWKKVDPKEVLGADYSSASGYRNILNKIKPVERQSGGSCGV
ncbi:MAG: hypothetical protein A3J46_01265 [Candidatus Yanofskybacteria bacterium RIFCSPHIGHO2_02_FULL_41_11]|uniref:Uncharacterized protein n=1 Tax=Candidatus Yanofskybacteria bacterium RIFCSPHIGHO2_02_FULL_41_11 TaxID=1802675 RepID=A0A1F8FAY3_9BACT|nr:MAG: hypothetical protein A3J46_01265 [Candidatus Yanofskybacteria bacterium RIFCSPHIGHO2_02_FULL_41_11]